MIRRTLISLAAVLAFAVAAFAAAKLNPMGATATNRFKGYFEAIAVLYHSDLPEPVKAAAMDALVQDPAVDKYIVFP